MFSTTPNPAKSFIFFVVLSVLVASCTSTAPTPTSTASASSGTTSGKTVIRFAVNSWIGSAVNVEVARYILEHELGYKTEAVPIGETDQFTALAKDDIDASLEVWPSGRQKEIQKYIVDDKSVQRGSNLGVIGKIGWYIPSYMVKAHPELATWQGFTKPENAALFATDKTGTQGQFLAGSPGWVQYDADIIRNLKLNLQVVRVEDQKNPEDAMIASLDAAYKAQKPILFYFWTPHWAYILYDLTEVQLPAYSSDCYAKSATGGVACDYPKDVLFKMYWPGLKEAAPKAYQFLEKFHYTNQDQISMLAMVQIDKKTPQEAAAAWIAQHESVWRQWLP